MWKYGEPSYDRPDPSEREYACEDQGFRDPRAVDREVSETIVTEVAECTEPVLGTAESLPQEIRPVSAIVAAIREQYLS